jgi:hypothetical protein
MPVKGITVHPTKESKMNIRKFVPYVLITLGFALLAYVLLIYGYQHEAKAAQKPHVSFYAFNMVADVKIPLSFDGDILLPSKLSQYKCQITPEKLDKGGNHLFRNIACTHTDGSTLVVTAACDTSHEDGDAAFLTLMSAGEKGFVTSTLVISCVTMNAKPETSKATDSF